MKIRCLGLIFMFLAAVIAVSAQKKTVTNADLDRYKAERIKAEEDLRQDYARKGISPDEVAQRNKESQKEMIDLSAKLRAQRLEAERLDAQRLAAEQAAMASRRSGGQSYYQDPYYYDNGYYGGYGYGYGYGTGIGRRGRFGRVPYQQPGYYAGGQFWATGPSSPPRPAFSVPHAAPRR